MVSVQGKHSSWEIFFGEPCQTTASIWLKKLLERRGGAKTDFYDRVQWCLLQRWLRQKRNPWNHCLWSSWNPASKTSRRDSWIWAVFCKPRWSFLLSGVVTLVRPPSILDMCVIGLVWREMGAIIWQYYCPEESTMLGLSSLWNTCDRAHNIPTTCQGKVGGTWHVGQMTYDPSRISSKRVHILNVKCMAVAHGDKLPKHKHNN